MSFEFSRIPIRSFHALGAQDVIMPIGERATPDVGCIALVVELHSGFIMCVRAEEDYDTSKSWQEGNVLIMEPRPSFLKVVTEKVVRSGLISQDLNWVSKNIVRDVTIDISALFGPPIDAATDRTRISVSCDASVVRLRAPEALLEQVGLR
jgi:hypothetical protein